MSSGRKCKNCGSSDIEVDPGRGDAVCTNCGSVLEDNIIVAEVQFEEGAHGTANTIGQFVSSDSKGGATSFGHAFHVARGMSCVESREMTLRRAKNGITQLCHQLRLNSHCIETAFNFFKMALSRNLTRGRKNTHVHAACVYLTCRTEGTAHMLIDISDVLQICCYELGRTYLRLSQALCINIPSMDPCLYILRFAAKLEFGSKTQEVANTALRLVQRMKRDSIHSGRRPSGLCGAALLMASRLHEFNRSTSDIIKIVKVHESTLRKRLIEFGDTPTSSLTLEEFLTVDLEEEQDPPSFKAARKKDKERLQRLMEEEADNITELQKDIEKQLERGSKTGKRNSENVSESDIDTFIKESTFGTISNILNENARVEEKEPVKELGPNIASMGLANSLDDVVQTPQIPTVEIDMALDDIDDEEIDSYIMNEDEFQYKNGLWHKLNASYLEEQKIKEEKLAKEKEEGKPEKKKRRRKPNVGPSTSAGEAIEKMLQEKKISSKINYDVLKSLNSVPNKSEAVVESKDVETFEALKRRRTISSSSQSDGPLQPTLKRMKGALGIPSKRGRGKNQQPVGIPIIENLKIKEEIKKEVPLKEEGPHAIEDDYDDYEDESITADIREEDNTGEIGVLQMLRQHRDDGDEAEEIFGTGYDGEEY